MAAYWTEAPNQPSTSPLGVAVGSLTIINPNARPEQIGSGSGAAVPTTGQIWPRGSKA